MRTHFTRFCVVVGAIAAVTAVVAQQRETRERGVIVTVTTKSDTPVTDMTAPDFIVRENGVAREVVRVSPAPPPTHVAFLIDDSLALEGKVPHLRPALAAAITKIASLSPGPQLALYTSGERPTRRVDFTPNPDQLQDAAKRMFPISNSGAYFLQTITDICRDLRKREAAAPVIVAFVSESGPEFSSEVHSQVADSLRNAGASLWAVTLQQGALPPNSSAVRERSAVLGDVVADSGGINKVVLSAQGIESGFRTITELLTSRYLVMYGRPESLIPPDKIEVTSRRRDVRVRAVRWAGK